MEKGYLRGKAFSLIDKDTLKRMISIWSDAKDDLEPVADKITQDMLKIRSLLPIHFQKSFRKSFVGLALSPDCFS